MGKSGYLDKQSLQPEKPLYHIHSQHRLNVTKLPVFREADIIHLHWINQGMLSLRNIREIIESGKPIVWTFADKMGLNDAIVEKDFWVCFTLDYLFHRSPWKRCV